MSEIYQNSSSLVSQCEIILPMVKFTKIGGVCPSDSCLALPWTDKSFIYKTDFSINCCFSYRILVKAIAVSRQSLTISGQ